MHHRNYSCMRMQWHLGADRRGDNLYSDRIVNNAFKLQDRAAYDSIM